MYSVERSEKSTGAATQETARPCRMRMRVRVSSWSSSWTWASDSSSASKQPFSNTQSAWLRPAALRLPGANSSPPYSGTGRSG